MCVSCAGSRQRRLQADFFSGASKPHLTLDGSLAALFNMLSQHQPERFMNV
jgi:hypothetical protein